MFVFLLANLEIEMPRATKICIVFAVVILFNTLPDFFKAYFSPFKSIFS
jgi:hypothetical protein